jgi:Tat protein secretion system quality control protein TatD with DNase activity
MRGKICLPEYIDFVAQKTSEIKDLDKDKVWQISRDNVKTTFGF